MLIKRLLDEDKTASGLILPTGTGNDDHKPWRGVIVACGPGDKMFELQCSDCGALRTWNTTRSASDCECGSGNFSVVRDDLRVPMGVKVGDEVLFSRSPANEIYIGGELHVAVHEEQHIIMVLEPSTA